MQCSYYVNLPAMSKSVSRDSSSRLKPGSSKYSAVVSLL